MGRIVVVDNVTLDGVMQAPAGPEEDPRDGFAHGGWAVPYTDPVLAEVMGKGMAQGGSMLFGRWTYESFFRVWPHRPKPNPFTDFLDNARKYVASRTLTGPLPWRNSTLLKADAMVAVAALRDEPGPDVAVLGSGVLVGSLMRHDLVDEYLLVIHPVVLGSGRRMFGDDGPVTLRLVDCTPTTTGVIIARYRPAGRAA
jgi:dihydrofolate reductase